MISVHLMTVYDTYETNKQNSCKKLDSTLCECEVILLQNATQSRLLEVFYSSRKRVGIKATTEVEDLVDWLLYSDLQESACLKYELDTDWSN